MMTLFKRKPKAKVNRRKPRPELLAGRTLFVLGFILVVFLALFARTAYIQVFDNEYLQKQSDARSLRTVSNQVQRGLITDRHGEMLAVSVPVRAVYADPKIVFQYNGFEDMRRWEALAEVLQEDVDELVARVQRNPKARFIYLKRQITTDVADYIKALKIKGIHSKNESRRFYPSGEITAQLIGLTNIDDLGIEGLERSYDTWLTGSPWKARVRKSADGHVVENLGVFEEGEQPHDLVLSLDYRIQQLAYRELKKVTEMTQASGGSVVVLNVHTGELLAMVNTPSYNPNAKGQLQGYRMRNRAVTDTFEPGSTMKPFVVAAALEAGIITPDSKINTSPGVLRIGGSQVRDTRNYGEMSPAKILAKSSNVGTSKLALEMGAEQLLGTYMSFGLGTVTGTDLTGEHPGLIRDKHRWSDFETATLSFGYALTTTTIQLARMYATLGSNGVLRPVSSLKLVTPPEGEQIIAPETAQALLKMLVSVTSEGGTSTKANIKGYPVAGKSGTSRKAVAGGYGDDYWALFAGVAPAHKPELAIAVVVNDPKGDRYYGGDVAAPVFANIMSGALQMMNIEPITEQQQRALVQGNAL